MGSFNLICGVSGQSIAEHDACVVIPVIQRSTYKPVHINHAGKAIEAYGHADYSCHPDAFWGPLGAAITGTYADCGYVEPDNTLLNKRAMINLFCALLVGMPAVAADNRNPEVNLENLVKEHAPVFYSKLKSLLVWNKTMVEGSVADVPFDELLLIWETLWRLTRDGRLFCKYIYGGIRPVAFSIMHQVTANYLIETSQQHKQVNGKTWELSSVVANMLAEIREKEHEGPQYIEFTRMTLLASHLQLNLPGQAGIMINTFATELNDLLRAFLNGNLNEPELVKELRPYMDGIYVYLGMDLLDLRFTPVSAGGQDYHNDTGRAYAKMIANVSKTVTQQRKKLYAE